MLVKHERRPFRFGVTLLAGLLGCLSLMGCKDEKTGAQAPTVPAVEVAVEIVTPQKVLYTTELAGRTSGFQIAEVRPQVSGIIQKRFFEEGADVKAGDVLYQIDPATYQANLDSAKANLARAEANVAPARLKMQRFKDLVNISAVSKQEFEDAEAAYKQALADVGVNKAAVENARIRLAYTKVTSPISGRSGRSLVTPGALVTENQSSPLTTVQQLDPVYVDVTQSSTEVLRLKRSLEDGTLQRADQDHAAVRLLLEDGSEYGLTGTLQFADVSVDESTGMVTLRAIFPNPKQELLPGMYVRAILNEGVDDQAILLPQRALLRDAKGNPTTISTRVRTLNGERLKVNDKMGNPIEIANVVVWHVADTAKALFDVDDYQSYVAMQAETALRHVASVYAYDHAEENSDSMDAITLRANVEEVSTALKHELSQRLAPAGVTVDDARLTHLAYSPEIAQAMLRRQQAEAVIAARKKIVEGAVSMVDMAVKEMAAGGTIELDEERKAQMASNLMVVLCGESEAHPIVNAGSLY